MNQSNKTGPGLSPRAWKQIAVVGLVVLVVGYVYAQPTLERWFGVDLPSVNGTDASENVADNKTKPDIDWNVGNQDNKTSDTKKANDSNPTNNPSGTKKNSASELVKSSPNKTNSNSRTNQPNSTRGSPNKSTNPNKKSTTKPAALREKDIYKDFFKSTGRNKYMSPEGLIYTMGPGGEHRVDHVLRHGKDMPNRPAHSVFDGNDFEIFELIDRTYKMIKEKSKYVKSKKEGNRTQYTITLGRKVGYDGGQKGKRNNNRALKSVKLILQSGNQVITAYPYR